MKEYYNIQEYVNDVIEVLSQNGDFFQNLLEDKELFKNELIKFCETKFEGSSENIILSDVEFLEVIKITERKRAEQVLINLSQRGDIRMSGVDEDGQITYEITEQGRERAKRWELGKDEEI